MEFLLVNQYKGVRIANKHSGCSELQQWLGENHQNASDWKVLMGIRNPFDSLVSKWLKIKSNHKGKKTSELARQVQSGAISFEIWVQHETNKTHFASQQFKKYMPCATEAIRFECIQDDWASFCERHQIPYAEIPSVNPTRKHEDERDFRTFYTRELIEKLTPQFASYLDQWGYHPPHISADHD